jgi:predicted lipoprotein
MLKKICLLTLLGASPALADVKATVETNILPGYAAFAAAADRLSQVAAGDCRPDAVRPAYNAAFDAWMPVSGLHLGPAETGALSIAFWPDDRSFTRKTLSRVVAAADPATLDPAAYAGGSIAGRGLFALEMMLYDADFDGYGADSYSCRLVQTIATDLAAQADGLNKAWEQEFAGTLIGAGQPGNATYLSQKEAERALYTQILGALEFDADSRLGRPMGTFEKPRPKQAEAWRSARSLPNILLSARAAVAQATSLAGADLPLTAAAAARVDEVAGHVTDPSFQDLPDPQARLKLEVLQQAVRALSDAIEAEVGSTLGIAAGFNSQDGD